MQLAKDVSLLLDALRQSRTVDIYRRWALGYADAILATIGKSFDNKGAFEKADRMSQKA